MHITFVSSHYENLGVEYLSAYLKKHGHTTSLLFEPSLFRSFFIHNGKLSNLFSFRETILNKISRVRPDAVAFSVASDDFGWAAGLAREIKRKLGVFIIFGGTHASSVPEMVVKNEFVDFVIRGEGEEAFLELADCLEDGKQWDNIYNLCFKRNGGLVINPLRPPINNLDGLPFPDKGLFFNECAYLVNQGYMVMASRGCRYSCSYCVNSVFNKIYPHGSFSRKRSIHNVINELLWAREKYKIGKVIFFDEDFSADKIWLKDFLIQYKKKVNLPFFCGIHPSSIDKATADLLADSGCVTVNIGIQTASEELRKDILNRKGSNEDIINALSFFRKTKVFVYGNIIFGLPGQTEQELLKTLEFCASHKSDMISVFWLRYYPKTAIIDIAKEKGLLSEEEIERIEASTEYMPFSLKGSTFDKKMSKIGNLIMLSSILPVPVIKFIIKKRYYRYFPLKNILFIALVAICFYKKLFQGKKYPFHYWGIFGYLRFYSYYIKKRLLNFF